MYDKRHDTGQPAQAHPCLCGAADAGQSVPAVLQSGRYHHRGPFRGRGCAGGGGQRGRPELSGAGLRQRHRLRLLHPHLVDLRREGLPRDAALHRQYRLAEPLFRRRAHGGDGGPDPGGAGLDQHPRQHHRHRGHLHPHHLLGHPLHPAVQRHQRPHARAGRQQAAALFPAGGQRAEHRPRPALHPHLPDGGVRRGLRHRVQSGGGGHRQSHLHRPPLPGAEMEQGRGPSEHQPLPQALQHGHPYGPAV